MADQAAEKVCPKCGAAMKLDTRPRPTTGIMFVPPKQWTCTNPQCHFSQDA
jgi:hypothetical protein